MTYIYKLEKTNYKINSYMHIIYKSVNKLLKNIRLITIFIKPLVMQKNMTTANSVLILFLSLHNIVELQFLSQA